MRRQITGLLLAALTSTGLALGTGVVAAPAGAATNPTCITQAEYNRITRNQTPSTVKRIVGTSGRLDFYMDNGFYYDELVEDGYWEPYTVYDGYYDPETGEYVDTSYTDYYWVDTSYYVTEYMSLQDSVRTFAKCKSWKGSNRRASVWFDDYTQAGSGMRVYRKYPYTIVSSGARSNLLGGKDLPQAPAKEKSDGKPLTPKPEVDKPAQG